MPSNNEEARLELVELRDERDLTDAWIARRINRSLMWVRRRGQLDDLALMLSIFR